MSNISCSTCRFYDTQRAGAVRGGLCRVNAPVFRPELAVPDGQWPRVADTDWCGKYEPVAATSEELTATPAPAPSAKGGRK